MHDYVWQLEEYQHLPRFMIHLSCCVWMGYSENGWVAYELPGGQWVLPVAGGGGMIGPGVPAESRF